MQDFMWGFTYAKVMRKKKNKLSRHIQSMPFKAIKCNNFTITHIESSEHVNL